MPAPGLESWAVFGTMRLAGVERATAQLAAFEVAGKTSASTLLGMSRGTALAVGGLGLLAAALTVNGIRKFATFDDAMNQSLAIMGDVSDTMRDEMADGARAMARETIFSAEQAAESYFFLASAGLDAEQSLAALPTVAKFAQAGMFDMALATDLLTDAQSALGLTSENTAENMENMARVGDVLVKANTLANATVEQFSQALTNRAAPRLRIMNKEIEEGAAVLAVFADQGIKGNRAGTTLDQTFRELTRRANENKEAFKDMNIEVFRGGEMRNIADIIEDMENALGGMTVQARQAALAQLGFTQRSLRGILALQGTSEKLRELQHELENSAGEMDNVANKQLDSLIKQLGLLGSEITDLFISMGEDAAPAVESFVRSFISGIQDIRFAWRELDRDLGEMVEGKGPFGLAELFLDHGVVGSLQIALDPSLLMDAEKFAEAMAEQFRLAEEFNKEINKAPPTFRRMLKGAELTGGNLEAFRIIVANLDERAAPFLTSLGEAAQVMSLMNEHGLSLDQALKSVGITAEEIAKGEPIGAPGEGFLPQDAAEMADFIDELVEGSKDVLTLTQARRDAGMEMLGIEGQIQSHLTDINQALEEGSGILTAGQEASLLRQRTALRDMLDTFTPMNTAIRSIQEEMDGITEEADAQNRLLGVNLINRQRLAGVEARIRGLLAGQRDLTDEQLEHLRSLYEFAGIKIPEGLGQQNDLTREQINLLTTLLAQKKELDQRSITQVGARQPFGTGGEPLPIPIEEIDSEANIKRIHEQANAVAEAAKEGTLDSDVWDDGFKQMGQIGENLVHALITGTFDKKDFLKQSLSRLVTGFILSPLAGFLGIASPSKITREYGRNVTVGLAEGITAESERVRTAWMGVASQITAPSLAMNRMNQLTGPSGAMMRQNAKALTPELKLTLDTSGLPTPKTPFEAARDAEWQKILRDSIELARRDGFDS